MDLSRYSPRLSQIVDLLNSLEISYSFANNYKHGIEKRNGEWDMFEPTRFIYAFFSFNMIYDIDWGLTISQEKKIEHPDINAKKKIRILSKFIFSENKALFANSLLQLDRDRELFGTVKFMTQDLNSSKMSANTGEGTIRSEFLAAAKRFSENEEITQKDHFRLLEMCYAVRNNLFHGEKKAHMMKEDGHRKRLMHYGNILLATNECFFEIMKKKINYRRVEQWELEENH